MGPNIYKILCPFHQCYHISIQHSFEKIILAPLQKIVAFAEDTGFKEKLVKQERKEENWNKVREMWRKKWEKYEKEEKNSEKYQR